MRTAIIFTVSLAAASARADGGPNNDEVWIGGGARALHSTSANALTGESLGGSTLGYARDLGLDLAPGFAIWAEGGMAIETAHGTLFKTMDTRIGSVGFLGGLRGRYRLLDRVVATANLDLGVQNVELELADGRTTERDDGWGTFGVAAAGLELYALNRAPFGLALRIEYGYVVTQGIRLTPQRYGHDDGTLTLPMSDASIGTLDLGGQMLEVSVSGQF